MGSLYRSEEMRFCQMIVERDAAFACVAELGKKPFVQFKDLNSDVNSFQRMFAKDIRRFDEMERKLRFLEAQIRKDNQAIIDNGAQEVPDVMPHHEINQLEQTLMDLERDVIHMNDSDQQLKKNFLELKEWQHVLEKADHFFEGGISDVAVQEIEGAEESDVGIPMRSSKEPMGYIVGVINSEKVNAFERILWRVCRRTAFVRHMEIEEPLDHPETGEEIKESVFIIFYNGDRLRLIIDKVCEGFKARQYNQCPKTGPDRRTALQQVQSNINDMRMVMAQTREHRMKVLTAVAANHANWLKQVRMHKSIYLTLNNFTFDGIGKFFVAECWVPLRDVGKVREALETGVSKHGGSVKPVLNVVHTNEPPPTYNRTNKFTSVFQGIVDSYGIATYLEVNPAPYTIITFPFIFSCMFGDLGHGCLMFLCGLYLVVREKNLQARQIKDEIFGMFFGGRYIILLMGLFSMHAGIIYNDAFAKSFTITSSAWRNPYNLTEIGGWMNDSEAGKEVMKELAPEDAFMHASGPYAFGLDPIWNLAENKLNFANSMKMKLSVILGITQMTFGVCLSYQNYKFFNSPIETYTVFIPQMIFMGSIFVYLCFQIVVKWLYFWVKSGYIFGRFYPGPHCAPSLLIGLINMFMFKDRAVGWAQPNGHEMQNCYLNQWYPLQSFIEAFLVIVAVIQIPIMLFGKPFHILMQQRRAKRAVSDNMSVRINMQKEETEVLRNGGKNGTGHLDEHESGGMAPGEHGGGGGSGGHHDEAFGDIMVHQAIHTIEYVLGCVSHTASYLRLWALSLAHAQLSEVLWDMILENAFGLHGITGYIGLYVIFFAFGVLTFSILVLMEGLSAFLHALRLHWVEFQSKFYLGQGYSYTPFYFKDMLQKAAEAAI